MRNTFLNVSQAKVVGADFEVSFLRDVKLLGSGPSPSTPGCWRAGWGELHDAAKRPEDRQGGANGRSAAGIAAFPDIQFTAMLRYRNGPVSALSAGALHR